MTAPRKGQKVRVTYEAEYRYGENGCHNVLVSCPGTETPNAYHLPPDATIEPIEDLQPGDVVCDASDIWFRRINGASWTEFGWTAERRDEDALRPFKLHIRDGQVVTP